MLKLSKFSAEQSSLWSEAIFQGSLECQLSHNLLIKTGERFLKQVKGYFCIKSLIKTSERFLKQVKGYSQSSLGSVSVPANLRQMYERVSIINYCPSTQEIYMTRNQINDTFLFQNRVKVKVVGEVSEKWN